MKAYIVEGAPARFGSGTKLGLSAGQLKDRAHNVEVLAADQKIGEDVISIIAVGRPVEFKIGERLYVEGEEAMKAIEDPLSGQKVSPTERATKARTAAKAKAKKAPAKGKR